MLNLRHLSEKTEMMTLAWLMKTGISIVRSRKTDSPKKRKKTRVVLPN